MKRLLAVLLLLQPVMLLAATKPAPNPADYTIVVHVVFSRTNLDTSTQQLETIIDGTPVEMRFISGFAPGILTPGDYHARLVASRFASRKPNGFDVALCYEFLLPDGTVRPFDVTGVGLKGSQLPSSATPMP